ncbi:hypothetical protein ABE522_07585 [Stenotrophomonas pennii]|uniref:DUF6966 domain-containing protein n=1 Tax=Stenotrophomonas lacuserhaii TaxID=2760084 RepID=UPI003209235C
MEDRAAQLDELTKELSALCDLLAHDSECEWRRHFVFCLQQAEALAATPLDQPSLNRLSGSVMSVFGGMGSFNDYVPFKHGRLIAGMEALDEASGRVYQAGLALRVIAARD